MVVAEERGFDDLDKLIEMFFVRRELVALSPKLLVVRVGGEEIDIRQVGWVAFAQIRDQFA